MDFEDILGVSAVCGVADPVEGGIAVEARFVGQFGQVQAARGGVEKLPGAVEAQRVAVGADRDSKFQIE